MGIHTIRLPDVGEGIAEAELAEWMVAVGDTVLADQPIAAVMTDKATVEIPSPVAGKVIWLAGAVGDTLAIGGDLIRLEVEGTGNTAEAASPPPAPAQPPVPMKPPVQAEPAPPPSAPPPSAMSPAAEAPPPRALRQVPPRRAEGERPLAAPSVRQRARDNGVDLRRITGSGPAGRITHDDLTDFIAHGPRTAPGQRLPDTGVTETRVIGLRRRTAEKMALAKARIAHITIVEEIDMEALEALRAQINRQKAARARLTLLPFLIRAMVAALREQPALNAHYDEEAGVVRAYGGVHCGIATQTPAGLMVPVIRHAEALSLWDTAAELIRLAGAARDGTATREELSGSTITITSLGPLGAIATTPIINHPEVAIVGVNRMALRPFWNGAAFVPHRMMNLSCSFDHRVIDGWDAAVFVQRLKEFLEAPALLFVGD